MHARFPRQKERTRRSDDARDNFSASSHLIYGVPVMEETCGDSRISSIESREESGRVGRLLRRSPRFHTIRRSDSCWLFSVSSTFPFLFLLHTSFPRVWSSDRITPPLELRKLVGEDRLDLVVERDQFEEEIQSRSPSL